MNAYISIVFIVFVFYMGQFLYGQHIKNNSIVDIFWGLGYVVVVWFAMLYSKSFGVVSLLTTLLVTIWGLRLFYHIYKRNHGKP